VPSVPLSLRLSEGERGRLEREAGEKGVGVSTVVRMLIRQHYGIASAPVSDGTFESIEDHERRLSRLEEMAGL
jgi:hypothetical protein